MKRKDQRTAAKGKHQPEPPRPMTGLNITPEEGALMRQCAAACGQTLAEFGESAIRERMAKLDQARLLATPCPFCRQTDMLAIITWNLERPDCTEYFGEAVRCFRCDSIATVAAWVKLGSSNV